MEALEKATFKQKEIDNIPKNAKILSKSISVIVEEIENGFLISKSTDIKYEHEKKTEYSYTTKRYFSKENPLEINLDNLKLADKIDV